MRSRAALIVVVLVASACSSGDKDTSIARPTTTVSAATTTAADAPATTSATAATTSSCPGIGGVPAGGEITFVRDGKLEAIAADGGRRCLATNVPATGSLSWNGVGDRLLVAPTTVFLPDRTVSADVGPFATATLSRPTGLSVLAVGRDRQLRKHPATGGPFTEVSFLARTEEAAYHPAGRAIAAVGTDEGGTYGVWIATNNGANRRPLAEGESAKHIRSLAFDVRGTTLFFVGDHGDHFDLHRLDLTSGRLDTVRSGPAPLDRVQVSPFGALVAVRTGDCGDTTKVAVSRDGGDTFSPLGGPLAGRSAEPVGWLPGNRLVVLSRAKGCDGRGELHVWTDGKVGNALVTDVERAAVRAALPKPGELPNTEINQAPA